MPEGPEVLLTSQMINHALAGKKITDIIILSGRYAKDPPKGYIDLDIANSYPMILNRVRSKGKFMWFSLRTCAGSRLYIWNTFGMTGSWSFNETKHSRLMIKFKKYSLFYNDSRNFGTFIFDNSKQKLRNKLKTIAPDFLKSNSVVIENIMKYDKPIVELLMDQKKIGSGIGNYLAAEILFQAKISPYRIGSSFTREELEELLKCIIYIMKIAYMNNRVGYMLDMDNKAGDVERIDYHPNIETDNVEFRFKVYGKKTDPDGNNVEIAKIVGTKNNKRSTYWVPAVQN